MLDNLEVVQLSVDQKAIDRYAAITMDYNPIHTDPAFAAATPIGSVIAHGTLSLNLLWQSLELSLGAAVRERCSMDIRYIMPVLVGDVVTAGGLRILGSETDYLVFVVNQAGNKVIEGTVSLA